MPVPTNIRLSSETALRMKLETLYGQDSSPSTTDNLIKVLSGLTFKRLEGSRASDNRVDPHFGARGEMKGSHYAGLNFSTYVDGVDSGGDVPSIGTLLQSCGFNQVVSAGNNVTYNPVQKGHKSATAWLDLAGELHKLVGGRGSVKFSGQAGNPLQADWAFQALLGANPANQDFPTVPAMDGCLPAISADDTTCKIDNKLLDLHSFSIDVGVQLQFINTTQGLSIRILQRASKAEATVIKPDLSFFNYRNMEKDPCDLMPFEIAHAGVTFSCASASMGITSEADINGAAGITIPLVLKRTNGNDDLLIKFEDA